MEGREFKCKVNRTEDFHQGKQYMLNMSDEITLSHVLRYANGIIKGGLPYGAQLARKLVAKGALPIDPHIVEIGGGMGHVADNLDFYLEKNYRLYHDGMRYTMVDISPDLLKFNTQKFGDRPNISCREGDATKLSQVVSPEECDVGISVEMMGDLPTIILPRDGILKYLHGDRTGVDLRPEDMQVFTDSLRMIEQYGFRFDGAPEQVPFNWGALKALEEMLSLGPVTVYISENSCENPGPHATKYPKRIRLWKHDEYEVSLSQVEHVAKSAGYEVETGTTPDFLEIEPDTLYIDTEFIRSLWIEAAQKLRKKHGDDHEESRRFRRAMAIRMYKPEEFWAIVDQFDPQLFESAGMQYPGSQFMRDLIRRRHICNIKDEWDQIGYALLRKKK
jgi:hypothetical protein